MSEQELNMMGDERGKDEASASAMLKKHETLEAAIADYSETVNELGDTAKALVDSEHPERYSLTSPPPWKNSCYNSTLEFFEGASC